MIGAVARPSRAAEQRAPARSAPRISTGSVMRAVSWLTVGHVLSQAVWFGSLIVLATLLPPSSFGTFTAGIVIVGVALLLMEGGVSGSLIAARDVTREQVRGAVVLNVGAGLGLTAVLIAAAGLLVQTVAKSGDAGVLRALSVSVAFTALAVVPLTMLQRAMQFKRYAAATAAAALIASVVAVAAAAIGAGVWSLVARQILYAIVVSVLAWWAVRNVLPGPSAAPSRRRARARPAGSGWFLALAGANLVALNLDYFIVGNLQDAHELGLYAFAFTLAFAPLTNFAWKLGTVLFPAVSATDDLPTVAARTLRAVRLMSLVLLPALVPVILLAPSVVPAVLGSRWTGTVLPFQILAVAGVGHALVSVIGDSLSGTGNVGLHARLQLLMCIALAPIMLVLVELDGIRGAAVSHVIVFTIVGAGYVLLGGRRLGIGVMPLGGALGPVALPVIGQAATSAVAVGVLAAAGVHGITAAVAATAAGGATAVILFRRGSWNPWQETTSIVRAALSRAGGR
jgi:O-antigen/teichoic acid export membrane protein